jgi:hypothetical protein
LRWIGENLRIQDKEGRLIALWANEGQLMLHASMNLQRARNLPVRIILLKPRQVGWTTWTAAEGFCDAYFKPNWQVFVGSLDTESTQHVFAMTKLFHQEMPEPRSTDATNRNEIVFSAPHRSRIIAQTAGKEGFGRSYTPHFFHGSEVAFWPNAKTTLAGVFQGIPKNPETAVVLESTANGVGGAFYDMFWDAVERVKKSPEDYSSYLPIFFPWYKFSEYAIDPTIDFTMSEEERSEAGQYNLTNAQIYWRRLKLFELNGDLSLFRQEYPATALEAFQSSGNPVFTQTMIRSQQSRAAKSPRYCIFTREEIIDVSRTFNCWQIDKLPLHDHDYCMGIDTMEGRLSDVQDVKSKLDCDAIVVMDRMDNEIVAIYHGRGNQADLAEQALYVAEFYNDCWVAPEMPQSMLLMNKFKEAVYPHLYNRQMHDERLESVDSENLGWRTTITSRPYMVQQWITAMRDNSLRVTFSDLIDEMKTFIRDKLGKEIHMPGKHDDILFAAMIALQVHIRCPVIQPYPDSHTSERDPRYSREDYARVGAVDRGEDYEEEEELQTYTL